MTLDSFTVGWIMGVLTGGLFGFMLALTIAHWKTRRPRKVELDNYTERLRALDRPQPKKPSPVIAERH